MKINEDVVINRELHDLVMEGAESSDRKIENGSSRAHEVCKKKKGSDPGSLPFVKVSSYA